MRRFATLAASAVLAAAALVMQPARAEPVNLTWFMWTSTETEAKTWKHVASMVTEKHPDITIEFQTASWPNYWTKLPALAASGNLPDIVSLQALRTPGFAELMMPLDELIARDNFDIDAFVPSMVEGLSKDGNVLALAYDVGPWVMFYNKDRFEAAGLPLPKPGWTEAEFLDAAKALTGDGKFGISTPVVSQFLAHAASMGATYLDADGNLDLANDGLKAAFADYVSLVTEHKVAPLLPPAPSGTSTNNISREKFISGEVASFVTGPWEMVNLRAKAGFEVGMVPLPVRSAGSITLSTGSGFGIAATSENKEAAWKAVQVLSGPEAQEYLGTAGRGLAARAAQQKHWLEAAAKDVEGGVPALEAASETALAFVTTPEWNTVVRLFEQYAPLAFSGSQDPGEVLETIQTLATQ